MLKRWKLSNFKSVGPQVSVEFGGVTLLAGVNGAGKSTLMQSILLVAQTLSAPDPGCELLLNGDLVSLGTADDVWHTAGKDRSLQIHFDMQPKPSGGRDYGAGDRTISVQSSFSLKADDGASAPRARLLWTQVAVEERAASNETLGSQGSGGLLRFAADKDRSRARGGRGSGYRVEGANRATIGEWERYIVTRPYGTLDDSVARLRGRPVSVAQFLPHGVLVHVRPAERDRFFLLERYLEPVRRRLPLPRELQREPIPEPLLTEVLRILPGLREASPPDGPYYRDYVALTREMSNEKRVAAYRQLSDFAVTWTKRPEDLGPRKERVEEPLPKTIGRSVSDVRDFFVNRMTYVSALRVAPRILWPLHVSGVRGSVGIHGEYLAQALDKYGGEKVDYWNTQRGVETQGLLLDALAHWLQYLGLVEEVSTANLGKLGYRLGLRDSEVDRTLDLASVGLGVSQVLPILAAGLLLPRGAALLVEQPEVHLHPRAQAQLGDFFLGMARTGRQVIVETHSEHILNRLLLRIAESRDDGKESLIKAYFVRRLHGETEFIPVTPNRYGMIEDWPDGFLDESAHEAQALLEASMRKRAPSRPSGQLGQGIREVRPR